MMGETLAFTREPLLGILPGVPGPFELVLVAFIILLLFGKRLPDLMGSLGRSIVEFKKGAREVEGPDAHESDPTGTPGA